jgi:acyl-coenzyme A synthetase/AMP-(fatty) acid ligase
VSRELEFQTSGSTGEPLTWLRTADQLRAEAGMLTMLCVPPGLDGILTYAPVDHLYGHLFGRAMPELLGVPARRLELVDDPATALSGWRRAVVVAVPASFAQLARCLPALRALDRLVVVHGGAALPPLAGRVMAALGERASLVELFGSTETGLVGHRGGLSRAVWTLAPDVTFASETQPGAIAPLRVRSPRIARRPGAERQRHHELDDVVRIDGERAFQWLGRRGRLLKVNGRRVNLELIETRLREAVPGVRLHCRPERDDLRGEWFTVVAEAGERQTVSALQAACRRLPAWQRPRAVRAVA